MMEMMALGKMIEQRDDRILADRVENDVDCGSMEVGQHRIAS